MSSPHAEPLRVALVGAGVMGCLHARIVTQNRNTQLGCVIDPDEGAGTSLAGEYDSSWVPDIVDFGPFDAVIVASPTDYHVGWATMALEAGKPVLIEKPVAEDPSEVARIVELARTSRIPIMCGLPERFNPTLRTLLEIVEEPLHIMTIRHSPFVHRIPGGVSFDLLIHDVDVLLRMGLGSIVQIGAQMGFSHPKSPAASEDVVDASLLFQGGAVCSLSASRISQRRVRRFEVAELERLIEVDLFRNDITIYRHVLCDFLHGPTSGYRQQTVIDIPVIQSGPEPLAAQLDHFLALIHGEADADAELASILPPHETVGQIVESGSGSLIDLRSEHEDLAHQ